MLGATPALAQSSDNQSSDNQSSDNGCVVRGGHSGTWQTNPSGKWVKCRAVGQPSVTGGGISTALVVAAGALGAAGLAVALGSNGHTASP